MPIINTQLIKSLTYRFKYLENTNIFLAASLLNYKFKNFDFISSTDERKAKLDKAKAYIKAFSQ